MPLVDPRARAMALAVSLLVASHGCGGASEMDRTVGRSVPAAVTIRTAAPGDCAQTFEPCVASTGTTPFVRLHGTIVTPAEVRCEGEVLFSTDSGRIECVDDDCGSHPNASGATNLCADGVVLPGLVDAHQHLEWNHLPPVAHAGHYDNRFSWRQRDRALEPRKRTHHETFPAESRGVQLLQRLAEIRLIMAGTTAAVGTSPSLLESEEATIGWLRNLDSPLESVRGGVGAAPVEIEHDAVIIDVPTGTVNESETEQRLSPVRARLEDDDAYPAFVPHLAEGIDRASRLDFDAADRHGVITAKTAVVQCTACSTRQFARLASVGGSLVWSPQSNADLHGETASVTTAHFLGVRIALGADWTASGSLHTAGEVACADYLNRTYYDGVFSDRDLVSMVTANGADSLGYGAELGRIAPGFEADLVVISGDRTRPLRALIEARPEQIRLVTVSGSAVFGDPELLSGSLTSGSSCEAIPDGLSAPGVSGVCGSPRVLCGPGADVGSLVTELQAALDDASSRDSVCRFGSDGSHCGIYDLAPLFRCGPPDLSRCHFGHGPIRRWVGEGSIPAVSGRPVPGDQDGDGVRDEHDNCPRVFNPPFDGSESQDDFDRDGRGDACDRPVSGSTDRRIL